jgi:predicted ATPase
VDLAGRTAELELMNSMFARHDRVGTSLLLRGAPGVGKTALLDAAAVRAADVGMRVLRASGVATGSPVTIETSSTGSSVSPQDCRRTRWPPRRRYSH